MQLIWTWSIFFFFFLSSFFFLFSSSFVALALFWELFCHLNSCLFLKVYVDAWLLSKWFGLCCRGVTILNSSGTFIGGFIKVFSNKVANDSCIRRTVLTFDSCLKFCLGGSSLIKGFSQSLTKVRRVCMDCVKTHIVFMFL